MTHWEIQQAKFNSDYSINIKFADGMQGVV